MSVLRSYQQYSGHLGPFCRAAAYPLGRLANDGTAIGVKGRRLGAARSATDVHRIADRSLTLLDEVGLFQSMVPLEEVSRKPKKLYGHKASHGW